MVITMQSKLKRSNNSFISGNVIDNRESDTMSWPVQNRLIGQQQSIRTAAPPNGNLFIHMNKSNRDSAVSLSDHQCYYSFKKADTLKSKSWLVITHTTTIVATICLYAILSCQLVDSLAFKETITNKQQQNEMVKVMMIRTNQTQLPPDATAISNADNSSSSTTSPVASGRSTLNRLASITALTLQDHRVNRSDSAQQQQQQATTTPNNKFNIETVYMEKVKPTWLMANRQYKIEPKDLKNAQTYGNQSGNEGLFYSGQEQAFDSPILLRTKMGILEGVRSIKFNKRLYTFLSIPYAKAPINELRFRAPQPIEPWKGIYQAIKWPPFCVQSSMTLASRSSPVHVLSPIMNEDCLYMNIWSPSLKYNKNHKRPVMVWFHGGAFQYGGVSVDENDGSSLALLGDVVVVTLNYRLNIFGFLNANHKEMAPNNVGLLDQRAALEWIQDNIKSFGGDPQLVTIFGESAGGHSVGLHMISPKSYKLFKRAILQSGVPTSFLRTYDVRGNDGSPALNLARRLGCYYPLDNDNNENNNAADLLPVSQHNNSNNDNDNSTSVSTSGQQPLKQTKLNETSAQSFQEEANTERLAKRWQMLQPAKDDDKKTTIETTTTTTTSDLEVEPEELAEEDDETLLDVATIECMRNKTSLDILEAMGPPGSSGFFPSGNDLDGFFPNGPIMESFDPDNLRIGPQKEFLIGVNPDEGTFMLHYGMPNLFPSASEPRVSNIEQLKEALNKEIDRMSVIMTPNNSSSSGDQEQSADSHAHLYKPFLRTSSGMINNIMPKYNGSSFKPPLSVASTFGKGVASLITDIIFTCPARSLASTLSEAKRSVYFYLFNHRSSQTQYHPWMGITHHDEVEFVFGRPLRMADSYNGPDIEMSQRMIKIWSHFAYTGQMLTQFNSTWPKYGQEDNFYMELNADHAEIGSRYHDKVCNIYDTVISVHLSS